MVPTLTMFGRFRVWMRELIAGGPDRPVAVVTSPIIHCVPVTLLRGAARTRRVGPFREVSSLVRGAEKNFDRL